MQPVVCGTGLQYTMSMERRCAPLGEHLLDKAIRPLDTLLQLDYYKLVRGKSLCGSPAYSWLQFKCEMFFAANGVGMRLAV